MHDAPVEDLKKKSFCSFFILSIAPTLQWRVQIVLVRLMGTMQISCACSLALAYPCALASLCAFRTKGVGNWKKGFALSYKTMEVLVHLSGANRLRNLARSNINLVKSYSTPGRRPYFRSYKRTAALNIFSPNPYRWRLKVRASGEGGESEGNRKKGRRSNSEDEGDS